MTFDRILELILGNLGLLFALIFILFGGFRRWWVWGWYAAELLARISKLEADREQAVKSAETNAGIASQALQQAWQAGRESRPDERPK